MTSRIFDIFKYSNNGIPSNNPLNYNHKNISINSIERFVEKSMNDILSLPRASFLTKFKFITTTQSDSSYRYIFKISNCISIDDIFLSADNDFGCINISKTKISKRRDTYIHYFYYFKLEDDMQIAIASKNIAVNQLIIDIPKTSFFQHIFYDESINEMF